MIKLFLLLLGTIIFAKDITPIARFTSVGFINDFVLHDDRLYVANDMGTVDIFDFKTAKIIEQVSLPPLTSSMNILIPADILSVDYTDSKLLILSVGKNSYRNVWIYENHTLKKIIDEDKKLTIKEARFIDNEKIMLSTLDADIMLHDTAERYNIYDSHISESAMQDFALNEDKTKMVISDESGIIKLIDVKTSKTIKSYPAMNLDNVYKVAYKNGVILAAGQDRRVGVYLNNDTSYYIKNDFLVFCVGLSPSAKTGVYSSTEQSDMQLFNPFTRVKSDTLVGHKNQINKIEFIDETKILSSERGSEILYWDIKQKNNFW